MAKKDYTKNFKPMTWDECMAYREKVQAVIGRRIARLAKLKEICAPKIIIKNELNLIADAKAEYRALTEYMDKWARRLLSAIFGK